MCVNDCLRITDSLRQLRNLRFIMITVSFEPSNAIIRLVGAVLAEQTDEWAEGRRYLGLDILAKSRLTLVVDNRTEEVNDTVLELSA